MSRDWLGVAMDCCPVIVDMFGHVSTGSIVRKISTVGKCELAMVVADDLSCSDILTCNRAVSDIVFLRATEHATRVVGIDKRLTPPGGI